MKYKTIKIPIAVYDRLIGLQKLLSAPAAAAMHPAFRAHVEANPAVTMGAVLEAALTALEERVGVSSDPKC